MSSSTSATFDQLVAEGDAVALDGWDFSWFEGRATEERPPWRYAQMLSDRMATASAGLDLQTGGGEVLAEIAAPPPRLAATEAWAPNLDVARARLAPLGADVVHAPDDGPLPFADASFDLVTARLPVITPWSEVARVLSPGGTFLSQQVGHATNIELTRAMMGEDTTPVGRRPQDAAQAAAHVGLDVVDLRTARCRVEFFDIASVVHFLRKVLWTVPDFTSTTYRSQLRAVDEQIRREGAFVSHSTRFLIEARRPPSESG
ncbi:class I SAM-dependent methyltransferase [Ruania halotolerans]|uniref:class I SAM-dependent methyltransferase n=1 Tax=Ruania halotolerans TaxID=2897773 RepID=UPI001E3189D8|nr:class I SAM-dependent methyltransferase [Ruania halotolerans]UFU08239.1 methyltransferase domain-containing protein [Ruania halotolerans]